MNEMATKDESRGHQARGRGDKVTVTDVRRSFNRKVANHVTVTWFGRPLANLLTPAFYNTGWSANQVTLLRIGVAALGVGLLLGPVAWFPYVAAFSFYAAFVLDCVDGNIARLRGTVTYWGKFLDGLADFVFVLGAPIAAGIGLWLAGDAVVWMLAGALITVTSLTSQMVRSRLSFMREWMTSQTGQLTQDDLARIAKPRRLQAIAAAVYVNGTFFAPLLLCVPGDGPWLFVLALLPLQLGSELVWLTGTMIEARRMLARPRESIHAARAQ